MDEVLSAVEQLTKNFNDARQRLYDQLKPAFGEMFQEYLNRYSFVKALSFKAYTPYFNDGDECIYSVHELEVQFVGPEEDYEEEQPGFYGPSAEDFIAFRVDGTVTENMRGHTDYYTKPRPRYSYSYWSYDNETKYDAPLYDSVEAYLNYAYPAQMQMSYAQLKQMEEARTDFERLSSSLESMDEDFIRGMFGDHVRVVITREGIETEEYSHD